MVLLVPSDDSPLAFSIKYASGNASYKYLNLGGAPSDTKLLNTPCPLMNI